MVWICQCQGRTSAGTICVFEVHSMKTTARTDAMCHLDEDVMFVYIWTATEDHELIPVDTLRLTTIDCIGFTSLCSYLWLCRDG